MTAVGPVKRRTYSFEDRLGAIRLHEEGLSSTEIESRTGIDNPGVVRALVERLTEYGVPVESITLGDGGITLSPDTTSTSELLKLLGAYASMSGQTSPRLVVSSGERREGRRLQVLLVQVLVPQLLYAEGIIGAFANQGTERH